MLIHRNVLTVRRKTQNGLLHLLVYLFAWTVQENIDNMVFTYHSSGFNKFPIFNLTKYI